MEQVHQQLLVVIYLKKDERLNEYLKLKEKFFFEEKEIKQSSLEKRKYKEFLKEYENYKNLYNKRNHQNIII